MLPLRRDLAGNNENTGVRVPVHEQRNVRVMTRMPGLCCLISDASLPIVQCFTAGLDSRRGILDSFAARMLVTPVVRGAAAN